MVHTYYTAKGTSVKVKYIGF